MRNKEEKKDEGTRFPTLRKGKRKNSPLKILSAKESRNENRWKNLLLMFKEGGMFFFQNINKGRKGEGVITGGGEADSFSGAVNRLWCEQGGAPSSFGKKGRKKKEWSYAFQRKKTGGDRQSPYKKKGGSKRTKGGGGQKRICPFPICRKEGKGTKRPTKVQSKRKRGAQTCRKRGVVKHMGKGRYFFPRGKVKKKKEIKGCAHATGV